jgi:putative chitinase
MKINELFDPNVTDEDMSRRGFLGALGAGALAATGVQAKTNPSPASTPKPVANNPKVEILLKWAKQFIKDPAELAAFMGQCAHESDNFNTMTEYGTPERFAKKYDIQYNPAKAKQLGNDKPGDGIKYRGRGYIQLTGKYNYEKAGAWVSKFINHPVDFVKNPDIVATPTAAALSSLWYWITFVKPKTKSFHNTKQVTKKINPGLKGQANREQKSRDWQAALNVKPPPKPGDPIKVASR